MIRYASLLSLALAGLLLIPVSSQAQQDQVYGKSGVPTRGTVTAVSPVKVTVQSIGVSLDVDTKDITKVTFDDEPAELGTARDWALAGQFEDALKELKKIDQAAIANEVIKQEVGYYTAYCLAKVALSGGGDKAVAIDSMKNFIGQNRGTFHFFEGVEVLGDLNFADGQFAQAATFYGLIAQAPWPEYKMKSAVLQGRAQAADGKYPEALANYEQVLAGGLNTPEATQQKLHATVGKAVCLAATGKHQEGITLIQDLIAKNDPSDADLFARAYNALGACYEKAGQSKEALLAYLHTDVLYFTNTQAHAEALYHLSKLWAEVNKSDRAVRARSLLQSRYPGSRWASLQ